MHAGSVTKCSLVIWLWRAYEFPCKDKKKGHMIEGGVLNNNTIIEGDSQDVVLAIRSQDCPPNWQLKSFTNEAYSCPSTIRSLY